MSTKKTLISLCMASVSIMSEGSVIEHDVFWRERLNLTLLAKEISVRGRVADVFSINTETCGIDCIREYLISQGKRPYKQANLMTWQDESRLLTIIVKSGGRLVNGYLIESTPRIPRQDIDFPFGRVSGTEKIIDVGSMDYNSVNHTWIVMLKTRSDFSTMVKIAKARGFRTVFSRDGLMMVMDNGNDHMVMNMVETGRSISMLINLTRDNYH